MKRRAWTDDERFMFATQRLRAQTQTNKKREGNRRACRHRYTDE